MGDGSADTTLAGTSIDGQAAQASPLVTGRISAQTVAVVTLAVLAVFAVLSLASEIVVPLVLAMVLKLTLQPAMRFLTERLRVPVVLASLLLIVVLFGLVFVVGLSIVVPATGWVGNAPKALQSLQSQIEVLRGPIASAQAFLQQAEHIGGADSAPAAATPAVPSAGLGSGLGNVAISVLLGTQHFFGRLVVLVVTLFFMLSAGDTMLRKLVEVMPRFHDKKHVVFITNEIERNISGYLVTITLINAVFGVAVGVAMYLCGIADPLLWGTVAFLLNFIPIVGPLIGVAVIFLVGLVTFNHALPALVPAAIYLALHATEGQMVTPMLLARQFTLSPLIVIVSLFFWNWMWGVPGAILSVPLLASFKIICDRIPSLAPLGHMLGEPDRKTNAGG